MSDNLPDYKSNIFPFPGNLLGDGTSGGGTGGGMESRIAKLEADVGHLKTRADEASRKLDSLATQMTDFKVDVAVLTERVKHLPSKGYSISIAVAMVAALAGMILFAERLKGLIGL